ncbi:hypothetical protein IAU60_003007 [Kwoniella sp. DSM 27419]
MLGLPPLAALLLTHFDDTKGQSVVFYASLPNLPPDTIEHTTLPSGLHALDSDLVLFTHHELPGAGVFRSRLSDDSARGRRMGTLGVVLAAGSDPASLFSLRRPLSSLFDQLEGLETSPFAPSTSTSPSNAVALLAKVWHEHRADASEGADSALDQKARAVRAIADDGDDLFPEHPVSYLPHLLSTLGPSIVPVYRAALAGQRIVLYSTPPLLPLAAFAWCIWAISLPPAGAAHPQSSRWLGNVGLMDLTNVKKRKGGWIATTSDAIYQSHHDAYDMFIDLSSVPLSTVTADDDDNNTPGMPTPLIQSTYLQPKQQSAHVSYAYADLPLYRSLLLLSSSPPTVHAGVSKTGGWWLLAFEVISRVWQVCVGVCEFAVGKGRVGGEGHVRLDEGEEDARLLGADDQLSLNPPDDESADDETVEDEAVRRGRLILRQLHHNTYHLHSQLMEVLSKRTNSPETESVPLTRAELKRLVGSKWSLRGSREEERFWSDLARVWGMIDEDD